MCDTGESILLDGTIASFLRDNGLVTTFADMTVTPLFGGISSDVWKVETRERTFVIKRALPRLRVSQVWDAPISRNASEAEWIAEAGVVVPDAAPRILARDAEAGIFAMTYFEPAQYPVWKQELYAGRVDPAFAAQVGRTIAMIHAGTAGSHDVARRFANDAIFHSIRIEPYLEATAHCHPDLAGPLLQLARDTLSSKRVLVHGDISPKNILAGPRGPVFLDAECAWFGEPAFDLSFCLNHLLLKCVWKPSLRDAYLASFDSLAASYLAAVAWEPPDAIEARTARLLPALLLARIDGKSPVEYIQDLSDKDRVRRIARPLIVSPPRRISGIRDAWIRGISA